MPGIYQEFALYLPGHLIQDCASYIPGTFLVYTRTMPGIYQEGVSVGMRNRPDTYIRGFVLVCVRTMSFIYLNTCIGSSVGSIFDFISKGCRFIPTLEERILLLLYEESSWYIRGIVLVCVSTH